MENLESRAEKPGIKGCFKEFARDCINPDNARLYGTFRQRAALNITQFPKIQGSIFIRMGLVYPIISHLIEKAGVPPDAHSEILGMSINYHSWLSGYLAYLIEIQGGLSKHTIEATSRVFNTLRGKYKSNLTRNS